MANIPEAVAALLQPGLVEAITGAGGCTLVCGRSGPQTITPNVMRHLNLHAVRLLAEVAEPRFGPAPHRATQAQDKPGRTRASTGKGARGAGGGGRQLTSPPSVLPSPAGGSGGEGAGSPALTAAAQDTSSVKRLFAGPSDGPAPLAAVDAAVEPSAADVQKAAQLIQASVRGHLQRRQTRMLRGGRHVRLAVGSAGCHALSTVEVAGSFDGWKGRVPLAHKVSKRVFEGVVPLRIPIEKGRRYAYKFIVDGHWVLDAGLPTELDESFHANHVLVVQDE